MITVTIEKNVPLPKRKGEYKWDGIAWQDLQIGDSFQVECTNCAGIKKHARKHGVEIVIRQLRKGCFRVWRVEPLKP